MPGDLLDSPINRDVQDESCVTSVKVPASIPERICSETGLGYIEENPTPIDSRTCLIESPFSSKDLYLRRAYKR